MALRGKYVADLVRDHRRDQAYYDVLRIGGPGVLYVLHSLRPRQIRIVEQVLQDLTTLTPEFVKLDLLMEDYSFFLVRDIVSTSVWWRVHENVESVLELHGVRSLSLALLEEILGDLLSSDGEP